MSSSKNSFNPTAAVQQQKYNIYFVVSLSKFQNCVGVRVIFFRLVIKDCRGAADKNTTLSNI